ncbi:MAG: hypothetical protein GY748_09885, partial [Planctomycetaceae bacterium]|nr:hypothetical protein [Planctomycetaceae bacterium]
DYPEPAPRAAGKRKQNRQKNKTSALAPIPLPPSIDGDSVVLTEKAIVSKRKSTLPSKRSAEVVAHSPKLKTTKNLPKKQRPSSAIFDDRWTLMEWCESGEDQLIEFNANISKHNLWKRFREDLVATRVKLPTLAPLLPGDRPNDDADNRGTSNAKKPNSGTPTLGVQQ